ncbi:MAG: TIM-barrel domain-containing protein, partial [Dehalococcoidia bacterium]
MQIILNWRQTDDGVVVGFMFGTLKLQVCRPDIVRVVYTRQKDLPPATSDVVIKSDWPATPFTVEDTASELLLQTDELQVALSRLHGTLHFRTRDGRRLLSERKVMEIREAEIQGQRASGSTLNFGLTEDEGIYGLGQFQHGHINQRRSWQGADAKPLELVQDNEQIVVPCYLSTQGYGVLFNTYSRITVAEPMVISNEWLLNDAVDYYFLYGPEFDRIVSTYRELTGAAPMFPKWAYGFWQSRCYYDSQSETEGVVAHYRRKGIPLDAMVVDYFHWRAGCGSMEFDQQNWPDPAAMAETLHRRNVKLMVSVWPSFQPGNSNHDEMVKRDWLLDHPRDCFLGRHYDPFNPEAGQAVWKMVEKSHLARGVDAWWLDASEPEDWEGWWKQRVMTAAGPCARVFNTFALRHTGHFYHGQREAAPEKRVYILARSGYAGQQRHAAASWSGDITTSFAAFKAQIPAGL